MEKDLQSFTKLVRLYPPTIYMLWPPTCQAYELQIPSSASNFIILAWSVVDYY